MLCPGLVATPLHSNSEQLRSASLLHGVASAAPHKKRAAQGVPPQEIAEGTIEAIGGRTGPRDPSAVAERDVRRRAESVISDQMAVSGP